MAWTDIARREHNRDCARYPSDLTDREWALIAPLLPAAKRGGRPRTTSLRAVMDAILYVGSSGCQWRALPKCFAPISTVRGYFYAWRDGALLATINHLLVMAAREQAGTEAGLFSSQRRPCILRTRLMSRAARQRALRTFSPPSALIRL